MMKRFWGVEKDLKNKDKKLYSTQTQCETPQVMLTLLFRFNCISFQQRIKKAARLQRKGRAPYLATPSKYIQDFSQEITLSIEFSTTTSSSIYYKTTVAKLHENTKIWSRPTLVQQSAIEREDAIERAKERKKN